MAAIERNLIYQHLMLSSLAQALVNTGALQCADVVEAAGSFAAIHDERGETVLAEAAREVIKNFSPDPMPERPALHVVK